MIEDNSLIFLFRYITTINMLNEMAWIMYYKRLIKFSLTREFEKSAEEFLYESILCIQRDYRTYLLYA